MNFDRDCHNCSAWNKTVSCKNFRQKLFSIYQHFDNFYSRVNNLWIWCRLKRWKSFWRWLLHVRANVYKRALAGRELHDGDKRECVYMCMCVWERERERERKGKSQTQLGEVRIKPVCTQAAFPLKKAVKHRNQKQRLVINNVYKCGVKTLKTCFLEQWSVIFKKKVFYNGTGFGSTVPCK
jgi:hypothetical protein